MQVPGFLRDTGFSVLRRSVSSPVGLAFSPFLVLPTLSAHHRGDISRLSVISLPLSLKMLMSPGQCCLPHPRPASHLSCPILLSHRTVRTILGMKYGPYCWG